MQSFFEVKAEQIGFTIFLPGLSAFSFSVLILPLPYLHFPFIILLIPERGNKRI